MSIDWTQSYTVSWRLIPVNKDTWTDYGNEVGYNGGPVVKSVHIDRDATSNVPMLESVSLDLEYPIEGTPWQDGWYRFEGVFTQNGYSERIPIITFLAESGDCEVDYGVVSMTIQGYSVLKPASDRAMLLGSYVPKGVNGSEYAANLLRECVLAPVTVDGTFTLDGYLAYGADTSYLEVVWDILNAGNFCISITGLGEIHIKPKPTGYSLSFTSSTTDFLFPKIGYTRNKASIPNVYRAISDNKWEEAVNDNPYSDVSTVSRGRRVDFVDTNPKRINGETLKAYAERKLEEESTYYKTYKYKREFAPTVVPFDMVLATLPNYGFEGNLRILTQSIDCAASVIVNETAAEVVKEYEAK